VTATGVDELLALRGVTRAGLEAQPDVTVASGVSYGALSGVDRVHAPAFSPAHFYFAGADLKLVYVPRTAVGDIRAADWLERVGTGPQLQSRTGKRALLEVRPALGFAFSHDEDAVELAEVFSPTTLAEYEREIYEDPGSFVR
jgi:hypothetical protein